MSVRETCLGCGEKRLLFEPKRLCIDCRDRGGVQLVLTVEATDIPSCGECEAIEAAVVQQERDRAREASRSRPCQCSRPWAPDGECVFCGHEPVAVAA
jgi:hypothetical protein